MREGEDIVVDVVFGWGAAGSAQSQRFYTCGSTINLTYVPGRDRGGTYFPVALLCPQFRPDHAQSEVFLSRHKTYGQARHNPQHLDRTYLYGTRIAKSASFQLGADQIQNSAGREPVLRYFNSPVAAIPPR